MTETEHQDIINLPQFQTTSTPAQRLWQAIEPVAQKPKYPGARSPLLNERRRTLLKEYLTTNASQGDLPQLAGVTTSAGVRKLLVRSMSTVYPHLPQDVRQEYGDTPQEALRAKSGHLVGAAKERVVQGIRSRKDPQTGKIEFSEAHRKGITEGNLRRHERSRRAREANGSIPK